MLNHSPYQYGRTLLFLGLAFALIPASVEAQQPAFAACISKDEKPSAVLTAPAAMGLSLRPDLQNLTTCATFCRTGELPRGVDPKGVEIRGDRSKFNAPYRYGSWSGGNFCFCGNVINGAAVDAGYCQQKRDCLNKLDSSCYVPQERDHMIFDLAPPRSSSTIVGTGSSSSAGSTMTSPPAAGANQRPNAPSVQPGGWEQPFPIQYEGAYQMSWRNNGDPDGDVLTFGVIIWQYDWPGRRWMQVPTIRDQYGTYGMTWLKEDNYTFTTQNGLSPRTHYAWMVFACDLEKGTAALCAWSGWQLFRTQ